MERIEESKHPLIREALSWPGWDDLPAGDQQHGRHPRRHRAGILRQLHHGPAQALHAMKNTGSSGRSWPSRPARSRSTSLNEPIGKQDQYIAAYGGITCFDFLPNDQVEVWPLKISQRTLYNLEDNLMLFFTGYTGVPPRSFGNKTAQQTRRPGHA